MALIAKVGWSLLSALTIASLTSYGPPSRGPERTAGASAALQQATAPDLSPRKDAQPAGILPSLVASGEVGAFRAASANAGARKDPDAAGSLPSDRTGGKSAVYLP